MSKGMLLRSPLAGSHLSEPFRSNASSLETKNDEYPFAKPSYAFRTSLGAAAIVPFQGCGASVARLPWAHDPRLQQLRPFLLTTNVSHKPRNLLFAQR